MNFWIGFSRTYALRLKVCYVPKIPECSFSDEACLQLSVQILNLDIGFLLHW